MKKTNRFDLLMSGNGFRQYETSKGYEFVTIMNNTDNVIQVHDSFIIASDPQAAIMVVPAYQALTYPLDFTNLYTFIWTDGGIGGTKKAEVIFSEINLNINTSLGGIGGVVGVSGNVEITNDTGNPIPVNGSVNVGTLPALAAGTNNIGDVDVLTLPALPSGSNTIGTVNRPVIGTHANAWNATAVGANGTSTSIDNQYQYQVSAFGNAGAATTITMQVSQDNTNFYDTTVNQVLAGAGNFHLTVTTGARYVRLKSSGAATITATIAGK